MTNASKDRGGKSHLLRNLVIVFLSALLLLTAVLGTVSLVKGARTYASYGGTAADRAVYSYLASYYKYNHMRALAGVEGAEDTDRFWQSVDPESKKTQGELLALGAKDYILRVLVCASLFDSVATSAEKKAAKEAAKKAAEEILTFRADGEEKNFDELCAPYGFAYDDLEGIALLLYKAQNAQVLFYGPEGEGAAARGEECEEYFEKSYTAAHLFFIRTETTYATSVDAEGNITVDRNDDGSAKLRGLLTAELEERAALMQTLDTAIATGNMTPAYFRDTMKAHYESHPEGVSSAYYFADGSAYTEAFRAAEGGETILTAVKSLKVGEYKKVAYADGFCYVYRPALTAGVYAEEAYEQFFGDFFSTVADKLFAEDVSVLMEDAEIKDRASAIDFTKIPYKNLIVVRF